MEAERREAEVAEVGEVGEVGEVDGGGKAGGAWTWKRDLSIPM